MNKHLLVSLTIEAYLLLNNAERDNAIKAAYVLLCKQLREEWGHPDSEQELMYKLMFNNYNSLYENVFVYLRGGGKKK